MPFPELTARLKAALTPEQPQVSPISGKGFFGPGLDPINLPRQMEYYDRNGFYGVREALGLGVPSSSGERVSINTSLALSTVWACNKIISESVGFLPRVLKQRRGKYTNDATSHPLYSKMLNAPNAEITGQTFGELLTSHCVMGGNGFAQIIRRSGTGVAFELKPLLPQNVKIDREKTGQKRLTYTVRDTDSGKDVTYTVQAGKPQDILHIRGLGWGGDSGYSVIRYATQSLGIALAQDKHVGLFYRNGGRKPYYLQLKGNFKDDQERERFRNDWRQKYSEPYEAIMAPDFVQYNDIGMSATDAQLIESRQFTVAEICRWFSVFPHQVGDLSKATFSNIEHLFAQFLRGTLQTWLTRWEQEFYRCVLTPGEQAEGYFLEHDLDPLLYTDFQTRMAGYATQLQNGIVSRNEVRAKEGWNPIEDTPDPAPGDEYTVQVNLSPLQQLGKTPPDPVKVPTPSTGDGD